MAKQPTYNYVSVNIYEGKKRPSWKPRMLRLPGIASLVSYIFLLIGLLETAARTLPRLADDHASETSSSPSQKRGSETDTAPLQYGGRKAHVPRLFSGALMTSEVTEPQTTAWGSSMSGWISSVSNDVQSTILGNTQQPLTLTVETSEYSPSSTVITEAQTVTPMPATTDYLPSSNIITEMQTLTAELTPTDYLPSSNFITTQQTSTVAPEPTTFLQYSTMITTQTISLTAPGRPPPSYYLNTVQTITSTLVIMTTDWLVSEYTMLTSTDYSTVFSTLPTTVSVKSGTRTTITATMTITAIANSQIPVYNPALVPAQGETGPFIIYIYEIVWPRWASFAGSGTLAVVLVILLQCIWAAFHSGITLIEPFAHLAAPGGALASETLFANYTSWNLLLDPFRALKSGRWLLFLGSLVSLVTIILAPLASEVLSVNTRSCLASSLGYNHNGMYPCPPQLVVNIVTLRVLEAILVVVLVLVLIMGFIITSWSTTGITKDPSSLAMIASLLNNSDFVNDIRSINPDISIKEMKRVLGPRRYCLRSHESSDGFTCRHGFVSMENETVRESQYIPSRPLPSLRTSRWPKVRNLSLIVVLLGLLAVIIAYVLISNPDNPFNRFFNSQRFGARFIFTTGGTVIAALWHNIYTEVNINAVFKQLSKGAVKAESTVLAVRRPTSIICIFTCLWRRQYFAAFTSFVDLLATLLVIALPGIPFKSGETELEFLICAATSIAIILVMILTLPIVYKWGLGLKFMPRQPDNLAALISFLVDSELVKHFDDSKSFGSEDEPIVISNIKARKWSFRRCVGTDGFWRWTVVEDTDALLGRISYK